MSEILRANDFIRETKTDFSYKYLKTDVYFYGDKNKRDIYKVTLKRGEREFVFTFGNSIIETEKGNRQIDAYDVLATLTKYNVGSIDDFISEFGYSSNEMPISEIQKIYKDVKNEYNQLKMLYNDKEMEKLREIN